MQSVTVDRANEILAEVFEGFSGAEVPTYYSDGELRDSQHSEPAELASESIVRAQCQRWRESWD